MVLAWPPCMKGQTMRRLRQYHQYLGGFFAPLIPLLAISGALQTFRSQDAQGYGGTPPSWIVWPASIHKDQAHPGCVPAAISRVPSFP